MAGRGLVEVKPDAKARAEREPMFADLLLIAGLSQLLEIVVFAMYIAVVAEPPLVIEVDIIPEATVDTDLYEADADRVPNDPGGGLHVETAAAQRQGRDIVLGGQIFIGGGQLSIERNDVGMISDCAADQYQQAPRFDRGGIGAG